MVWIHYKGWYGGARETYRNTWHRQVLDREEEEEWTARTKSRTQKMGEKKNAKNEWTILAKWWVAEYKGLGPNEADGKAGIKM